jgi:hypothetical protein
MNEATKTRTCTYDSGSMSGCAPLCSAPAVYSITYRCMGPLVAYACRGHKNATLGRIAQPDAVLVKL